MEFIAIDVETANPDMASICQIGLVRYFNGDIVEDWKTYIDPEDEFDEINISIHGIDEKTVKGAPKFNQVANTLYNICDDKVLVCHTHFDRVSIAQAAEKYRISYPSCTWLDSARVARRTWKEFSSSGYGLYNISKYLGYEFKHHDALEDAKACANILIKAMEATGVSITDWIKRVEQPLDLTAADIRREGNPEGPLFGEALVFTGALTISRREAADIASQIGCKVLSGVNKDTTILVVGDQDIRKLNGYAKSSKHRKAEELIKKGARIRIITEPDFIELAKLG